MIEGQLSDPTTPTDTGPAVVPVARNGAAAPSAAPGADGRDADPTPQPAISGLDEVQWHPSYDRESVDRFLGEVESEKARLVAEIAAAEARAETARQRLAAQKAYNEEQLGALVVSARTELDRIEKEHADAVMAIRATALEKAARILEVAHREASAVSDASASLAHVVPSGAATRSPSPSAQAPTVVPPIEPEAEEREDVG